MPLIRHFPSPHVAQAKAVFRKRGLVFAPHAATLAGSGIVSGLALATDPLGAKENIHDRVAEQMSMIFSDVKATATEFNARGDYGAGLLSRCVAYFVPCLPWSYLVMSLVLQARAYTRYVHRQGVVSVVIHCKRAHEMSFAEEYTVVTS